ncbi:MAG: glycine zipper domain-containing protein [Nibricoccus sp.]
MKTYILALLCAAGLTSAARAEIFRPTTAANVLVGGIAGALIGENNNHHAAEGALIGATAGYLWSKATEPSQPSYAPPVPQGTWTQPTWESYDAPRTVVVQQPVVVQPCAPTFVYRQAPRRVVYVAPAPVVYCGPGYYSPRYHRSYHHWR